MRRSKHTVVKFAKLTLFSLAFLLILVASKSSNAQCIQFIDAAGDTTAQPVYVNCIIGASPANVSLSFINVNALTASTINWGDGGAVQNFASIAAGQVLNHVYSAAIDTYLITVTQLAPLCVTQIRFINERSVIAQITPLTGSVTTICAPNTIQFVNKSTNVSKTTIFTLDYGDGTPVDTFDHTNANDTISHVYLRNRVSCNTVVTLTARNRCTGSVVSTNTYGPIQVYDLDSAIINANKTVLCYPDTTVTFTNSTIRNCFADGNTQQRFERWIIRDFKGPGIDSVTAWIPWPPSNARTIRFKGTPRPVTYTIILLDSSFCGIDTAVRQISIIDPPNAFFTSVDTVCGGSAMSFSNASTVGMTYAWNFGDGNTSTATNPNNTFNNTGAGIIFFDVRLIVTNPLGFSCSDTFIKRIYVLPRPTSNFSLNNQANNINGCDSLVVNFTDNSTNATQWQWDFDNNGTFDFTGQTPPSQKYFQTTTIRLRVTSADGCSHDRTRTVNIFRSPDADFTVSSVCVNQAAAFTNTSIQYPGNNITSRTWNFDDPSSGVNNTSNLTNPTHVFSTPGIYNVRLIVQSQNACPDTIIKQLNVQFPPTANFNPSVISGCSPLNVTLNNSSSNADPNFYVWKRGNTTISTSSSPTFTFTNNGTSNDTISIKLIAQTTFGCRDSITKTIVVFPNPIASIAANTLPSCNPSPINFLNTSTGAISYNWDFDDGNTSILPNPIHQFTNNTNQIRVFNVRLIARNVANCTDTTFLPVLVYPDQNLSITTNVDSGCTPLIVNFPSFPGVVSYQWDFGDAQSSNTASPQHTYVNLTNNIVDYQCRGIFENAFGCRDTVFKTIRVKPLPGVMFNPDNSFICSPDTIEFQNTSTNASRFIWYFGDGDSLLSNTTTSVQHRYTNNGTAAQEFEVILRAFNNDSCFQDQRRTITVYPKVQARFTIDTLMCSPYNSFSDNRSINGNKYYWYLNNSLIDSSQNRNFNIANLSNVDQYYDIKLQVISLFGCSSDTTIRVRVLPEPTASFITDLSSGCQPLQLNITNQSTPGITYQWDFGDGETSNNTNATFQKTFTNTTNVPIERDIVLAVQNSFGCVDTFSRRITVFPELRANFNLSDTILCSPFVSNVFNTSTNTISYQWFIDNALIDTAVNPTINIINNTASVRIAELKLIASSAYGCTSEFIKTIRILPRPNADFIVSNAIIKFPQNTFNIINQNIQAGLNYKWYFGNGDSSLLANPATYSYANPGTYTITLIVFNSQCADTLQRIVKIEPPSPVVSFIGSGQGCAPLTLAFTNNTLYADRYEWDFGDGKKSNEKDPIHTYTEGGLYTVSLIAYGEGGQSLDVHVDSVNVYGLPNAFFISQPKVVFIPSDPVVFFNLSQNAVQYFWDFGDGFTSTEASPTHYYLEKGEYDITLIVRNAFGCTDTFVQTKAVKAESGGNVVVPNAFTPNPNGGNGGFINRGEYNNDVFYPVVEGAENYRLTVYNRWGELLFESNDINIGWDGYYKGQLCKQDVYIWKVELFFSDGTKKIKTGDLLLLR